MCNLTTTFHFLFFFWTYLGNEAFPDLDFYQLFFISMHNVQFCCLEKIQYKNHLQLGMKSHFLYGFENGMFYRNTEYISLYFKLFFQNVLSNLQELPIHYKYAMYSVFHYKNCNFSATLLEKHFYVK